MRAPSVKSLGLRHYVGARKWGSHKGWYIASRALPWIDIKEVKILLRNQIHTRLQGMSGKSMSMRRLQIRCLHHDRLGFLVLKVYCVSACCIGRPWHSHLLPTIANEFALTRDAILPDEIKGVFFQLWSVFMICPIDLTADLRTSCQQLFSSNTMERLV